jgi:hypothetical protein
MSLKKKKQANSDKSLKFGLNSKLAIRKILNLNSIVNLNFPTSIVFKDEIEKNQFKKISKIKKK